jgi:uncharacterized protein DUF6328
MTDQDDAESNETEKERLDRKWGDLLQELRVMQTGAQLTAGFLLTLPFQQGFAKLDRFQLGLYLALVILAGLVTAFVMTAVAVHRRLSGAHVKELVVNVGHRLTIAVLAGIALLITGMVMLIFDVVVDRTWAIVATVAMAASLASLLLLLPARLIGDRD